MTKAFLRLHSGLRNWDAAKKVRQKNSSIQRRVTSTTALDRILPIRRGAFFPVPANLNWDAPWTVKSAVSDIGWSTEMEIPFTSLRFGAGDVQTWGFNFERRIRRNNEIAFWAPLSQERNLTQVSEAG